MTMGHTYAMSVGSDNHHDAAGVFCYSSSFVHIAGCLARRLTNTSDKRPTTTSAVLRYRR